LMKLRKAPNPATITSQKNVDSVCIFVLPPMFDGVIWEMLTKCKTV